MLYNKLINNKKTIKFRNARKKAKPMICLIFLNKIKIGKPNFVDIEKSVS